MSLPSYGAHAFVLADRASHIPALQVACVNARKTPPKHRPQLVCKSKSKEGRHQCLFAWRLPDFAIFPNAGSFVMLCCDPACG